MKKFLLIGTIFFQAISAQADFADGENFFDNGEFTRAFSEFLPLANNGDFRSQYYIGYLYLNGLGVAQDLKLAIKYLQQSSDQEYDMAQSLMAFLYEKGEAIPKDMKKALSLYRKAAAQTVRSMGGRNHLQQRIRSAQNSQQSEDRVHQATVGNAGEIHPGEGGVSGAAPPALRCAQRAP